MIDVFDSKKNKISFINGNSYKELQYLIKAFILYVNLKKYTVVYVSENHNKNMIQNEKILVRYHILQESFL